MRRLDDLLENPLLVCLFLTLLITTMLGIGNILIVSLLGLLLCLAGALQRPGKVDLWILAPLILYNLLSMASSWRTFGNAVSGYASTQMLYPVIYLVMACLDFSALRRLKGLCAAWAGAVAAVAMGRFAIQATMGSSGRLEGALGNPNALGIFLVIGWFALIGCREDKDPFPGNSFLPFLEPLLLMAAAMTVSMGSFVAMAAGILSLLYRKKREHSYQEAFLYGSCLLSKASLGMGTGMLIYLAADRTGMPWLCLPFLFYGCAMVLLFRRLETFLEAFPKMAAAIPCLGLAVGITAIAARPNAAATFVERLEMIRNGIRYLGMKPLLGVGPYQWRILNLYDGDKYFHTYHIHNLFVHVGVEMGLPAMAMLAVITIRILKKEKCAAGKAGFIAFLVHNLMDTSFFYMGITTAAMLSVGEPGHGGTSLDSKVMGILWGGLGAGFALQLYYLLLFLN